ncbi:MAG: 4Fe-4S ferredoxin [Dehalococcoidia bacterium]|nr:4Fe-4S ferredoxin [Dehalococcoidia bacterium]
MAIMPDIDGGKCNACGLCVSLCSCNAFVFVGQVVAVVETELCNWCTDCEAICPLGAIRCPFEIVFEEI